MATILKLCAEPQILGNRPSRDETNSQPSFNGGFDGLGRIKFHHDPQRIPLDALPLQRHFNHSARAGSALAHQQRS